MFTNQIQALVEMVYMNKSYTQMLSTTNYIEVALNYMMNMH